DHPNPAESSIHYSDYGQHSHGDGNSHHQIVRPAFVQRRSVDCDGFPIDQSSHQQECTDSGNCGNGVQDQTLELSCRPSDRNSKTDGNQDDDKQEPVSQKLPACAKLVFFVEQNVHIWTCKLRLTLATSTASGSHRVSSRFPPELSSYPSRSRVGARSGTYSFVQ